MSAYLTEEQNMTDIVSHIHEQSLGSFNSMKSKRVEAAFSGRFFVVYRPTGLTKEGQHRSPEILGTFKILDFQCSEQYGADFTILDLDTQESMTIGHVPTQLFDYDLFACVPVQFALRWDAREHDGQILRSLVFPISLYTTNRSSFYSAGVTYIETPNRFRELYKDHDIRLNLT